MKYNLIILSFILSLVAMAPAVEKKKKTQNELDSLILNINDLPENYNDFIPIIEGEDNINNNKFI